MGKSVPVRATSQPIIQAAHADELSKFVPSFILSRLTNDPSACSSPHAEPSQAAVLFADISGFTALSEKLASRGPDGVEELTQVLNSYFGKLIEIITAHGGDVVKFAGDAMLAYWPAPSQEDLLFATRSAAQCGLEFQRALQTFGSTIGHRLFLRVGVGAGRGFVVTVGGVFERWESVLVGPPMLEATLSASKGEPGQVVLGAEARRLLGADCEVRDLPHPGYVCLDSIRNPIVPAPLHKCPLAPEAVQKALSYIPAAIHRRIAAGQSGWLAEMRLVTVLFVNLPGLDEKTPLARAQEAMHSLQTELYRFEGSVNKLSLDEKGVTLVGALGLPPLSHEDDAVRGVLAGLAMHAELRALGWKGSVGIATGRVFCGTIGGSVRCEYTIMGDRVNLAARLMQAAKGGILCDEATFKAASGKLRFETLEPIMVKGKTNPIPIYLPLGEAAAGVRQNAGVMVGRQAERELMARMLDHVLEEERSGVLLVEGEAGIGKSTIVNDFVRHAQERKATTWLGAALAMERSTSYFPWRAVFRQLFRLDANAPLEEQRKRVLEQIAFDPDLVPLAPLLDAVLALDFPPTPETAQMFGEARLSGTNAFLIRLLARQTASGPLVLVLEDCHWFDSASWVLARQASQQVPSLLLVMATRPLAAPFPRDYAPIASSPATRRIVLNSFSVDESIALVKRRLDIDEVPDQLVALLTSKAQGNPFFIEELAYALRDSGHIRIVNRQCIIPPGVDLLKLPFPDNVQGVVTSRIDRLAPPEQLALKVASVIGRSFSSNILRDVCPIEDDKPNLGQHLEVLCGHALTVLDAPLPEEAYSFKHVITQEVSYQMMAPAQRKSLHVSVAVWYESHHSGDLSPYYPLLAKHWSNTDEIAKAIDYMQRSGENAMRDFAHEEAVTFFTQALELDARMGVKAAPAVRAYWHRQLGEAHYNLSDLNKAREHFWVALELLGSPSPKTGTGFVVASLWDFVKQMAHRALPRWFVGRARARGETLLEVARAYERLAQIHYLNNAKVSSIHAVFRSLNVSETVGDSPELARSYANAAVIFGLLMLQGSARAHARRARAMVKTVNQPSCTAYAEFICGLYFSTVGAWPESEACCVESVQISERIGEKRRWYEATFTLASLLSRKGDFSGSYALVRELHRSANRRQIPQIQVWGATWELWTLLVLDPNGERTRTAESALGGYMAAHPNLPLGDRIMGLAFRTLSLWRRGERAAARSCSDEVDAIIAGTNQVSHYLLEPYSGLAEFYTGLLAVSRDDAATVREMDKRIQALLKVLGQFAMMYPIAATRKHLVRGWYERARGNPRRARRAFERCLAASQKYQMPYEQAQAHLELSNCDWGDPAVAANHRARARELFEQIGARPEDHVPAG